MYIITCNAHYDIRFIRMKTRHRKQAQASDFKAQKNCDFLNCLLVLVSCVKKGKNQTVERINLSVVRVHEK